MTTERITSAPTAGTNPPLSYTYDAVGNRLACTSTLPGVPTTTHADDAYDRLTSDIYDASGNPVAAAGQRYAYDSQGRLVGLNMGGSDSRCLHCLGAGSSSGGRINEIPRRFENCSFDSRALTAAARR